MSNPVKASMVERVARAIAIGEGREPSQVVGVVNDAPYLTWHAYEREARSAIAAMREPTEAMVEVGLRENTCSLPLGGDLTMAVEPAWEAMIDAALAGSEALGRTK